MQDGKDETGLDSAIDRTNKICRRNKTKTEKPILFLSFLKIVFVLFILL